MTSAIWTTAPLRIARPETRERVGRIGYSVCISSRTVSVRWWCATRCTSPPSKLNTAPYRASHNRTALSTMASNTGWTSVGEREITRRISLVAVC